MNDRARSSVQPAPHPPPRSAPQPMGSQRRRVAGPRPRPAPRIPAAFTRSAPLAALWTGFAAAALGCVVAVLAAFLVWIPDAGASGSSTSTVRAGIITYLAALHGGVRLNGVTMQFVPLGLTLVAAWICWRAGRVLNSVPVVRVDRRPARIVRLTVWQLAGYVVSCAALVPFARVGTTSVTTPSAIGGSIAVGALGFGLSSVRHTPLGRRLADRLPTAVRAGLRGAVGAALVYLVAGACLVALATVTHASRFMELSRELSGGAAGLPIAFLNLLTAPNAVLAGSAYLAGPGFAVGVSSTYAPFGGHGGLVPAFPIVAGLPNGPRASGFVEMLLVLTMVIAGLVAGGLVRRSTRFDRWPTTLGAALLAGAFGGVLLGLMTTAAGGSLGRHNLRAVGASPWQVALMTAAEIAAGTLPVAVALRGAAALRHRRLKSANPTSVPASVAATVPTVVDDPAIDDPASNEAVPQSSQKSAPADADEAAESEQDERAAS